MKGAKQDLAWVRNDAHIDELCRAMKLNAVACDGPLALDPENFWAEPGP